MLCKEMVSRVIAIMEDFNQKMEEKFRHRLQGREKLPLMEAMEVYQTVFMPENSFFYHLSTQDVEWMKENLPKDVLFNPEADKKKAEYEELLVMYPEKWAEKIKEICLTK